jgi:anti-sigma factor (TIGR02949 family)
VNDLTGQSGHTTGPHEGHAECSEVLHRIFEFLDGEMSAGDVARVTVHLQECRPCLAQHDFDLAMKEAVRRSNPPAVAPTGLRLQIVQRISMARLDLDPGQ